MNEIPQELGRHERLAWSFGVFGSGLYLGECYFVYATGLAIIQREERCVPCSPCLMVLFLGVDFVRTSTVLALMSSL